jgi:hypothetical protein
MTTQDIHFWIQMGVQLLVGGGAVSAHRESIEQSSGGTNIAPWRDSAKL